MCVHKHSKAWILTFSLESILLFALSVTPWKDHNVNTVQPNFSMIHFGGTYMHSVNYAPINDEPPRGVKQGVGISLNILAPGGGICSSNESRGWGHLIDCHFWVIWQFSTHYSGEFLQHLAQFSNPTLGHLPIIFLKKPNPHPFPSLPCGGLTFTGALHCHIQLSSHCQNNEETGEHTGTKNLTILITH